MRWMREMIISGWILLSLTHTKTTLRSQVRHLIEEKGGRAVCFLAESKKFEYRKRGPAYPRNLDFRKIQHERNLGNKRSYTQMMAGSENSFGAQSVPN